MVKLGDIRPESFCWLGRTDQVLYKTGENSRLSFVRIVEYKEGAGGQCGLFPVREITIHNASQVIPLSADEAHELLQETYVKNR